MVVEVIIFPVSTLRRWNRMERFKRCELKPLAATLKFVALMGRKRLKTET